MDREDGVLREPGEDDEPLSGLARLALVAAWVGGSVLRVGGVALQPLRGDENNALGTIAGGYGEILTTYFRNGAHPGYSLLKRASMDVFGASAFTYRLPSIVAGIATLLLLYPLGKRLVGSRPAWAATLFLALHPMHLYYSREGRPYAVAVLLALLLLFALARALRGSGRAWIGAVLAAALLPWIHLSSVGPLVCLGVACLLWCALVGGPTRRCALAFGAAGLLAVALYVPAREGLAEYVTRISELERRRPADPLLVASRYGGTLAAGLVLVVGGILASTVRLRRPGPEGMLLLVAGAGPVLGLLVAGPGGMEWAYARYLLVGLPALLLAAAWGVLALARRLRLTPGVALTGTAGAILLAALLDPLSTRELFLPFSNSRWVLLEHTRELGALREGTPRIYERLAASPEPLVIVEHPFGHDSTLLFRDYQRKHGHRTVIGVVAPDPLHSVSPYVPLSEETAPDVDADWVLLHLDLVAEAAAFSRDVGLRVHGGATRRLVLEEVEAAWGQADYSDGAIAGWYVGGEGR